MKISGTIAEGILSLQIRKLFVFWLNVLCWQQFKEISVEVLLDRYSLMPYHYAMPKVGHLPPVKCPITWSQSNAPPGHLPLG